ncbi:MAG: dihydrofolate reductase [Candidatus Sericytochromatia bacterium]
MQKDYKIIVAYDEKNGIGKDLLIPWYFPEDLKRVRELTLNQNIIMGYKTFKSIIDKIGKPLPKRNSIVLSKKIKELNYENTLLFDDYNNILEKIDSGWIFGGGEIYNLFLPYCHEIYATEVKGDYDCNIFFPKLDLNIWKIAEKEDKNDFSYVKYVLNF